MKSRASGRDPSYPALVSQHLFPIFNRFLPGGADAVQVRRGRLLVASAFSLAFIGVAFAIQTGLSLGYFDALAAIALVQSCFLVCIPTLLPRTKTTTIPGTILVLELAALALFLSFLTGEMGAPILYWSAALPLLGALLVGPWLANLCAGLIVGATVVFYGARQLGYVVPSAFSSEALAYVHVLPVTTLVLFAALLGWFYEGETVMRLQQSNRRLRRARRSLHKREARFRALVQHASDLITVVDRDGIIRYQSPSSARILGLNARDLKGRSLLDVVHPDDAPALRRFLERKEANRDEDVQALLFRFRHADSSWLFLEATGSNLCDDPAVRGFVLNTRDVTERQRYEKALLDAKEQAEHARQLQAAFLANISHEIRTPITSIQGFADLLAEDLSGPQRNWAATIRDSSMRLLDTFTAVLDLAHLEQGNATLEAVPLSMDACVTEQVRLFQAMAQSKGLVLSARYSSRASGFQPWVLADPYAVARILANLLDNAVKFTHAGSITVDVRVDGRNLYVDVRDTGIGIDPDFVPHLYEKFSQESTGMGRDYQGAGLGLAIVKQLVDRMEGTITVESEKGRGTTFTLCFPRLTSTRPYRLPSRVA